MPAAIATAIAVSAFSLEAAAQQPDAPAATAGSAVTAGSAEEELGQTLARVVLADDDAARSSFAAERIGPRFLDMLGGQDAAVRDLKGFHALFAGGALKAVRSGPNGSIYVVFTDAEGHERPLHVLRGVTTPDGRLKVGGWVSPSET